MERMRKKYPPSFKAKVDLEEIKSVVECAFEKIKRENLKEGFFPFLFPGRVPA